MLFSACCINFLTMLPPILPASLAEMFPLYPSFKVTPTSDGVKKLFEVITLLNILLSMLLKLKKTHIAILKMFVI